MNFRYPAVVRRKRREQFTKLCLESLEGRLPLATFFWIGPNPGAWNNPNHWQSDAGGDVPGSEDSVRFDEDVTVILPANTSVGGVELVRPLFSETVPSLTLNGNLTAQSVSGQGSLILDQNVKLKATTVDISLVKVRDQAILEVLSELRVKGINNQQRTGLELDGGQVLIGPGEKHSLGDPNLIEVFPGGVFRPDGDVVAAKVLIYGNEESVGELRHQLKSEIRPVEGADLVVINSGRIVLEHTSDVPIQSSSETLAHQLTIVGDYFQPADNQNSELEFVVEAPASQVRALPNPPPGGRLYILGEARIGGTVKLNTNHTRFFSYAATTPRDLGWAPLLSYESLVGRFENIVGAQFHFFNSFNGTIQTAHDRFLGINYQEKFIDLMLLETPQRLDEVTPGNWDTTIPPTGDATDPADGTRKHRLTANHVSKENLVLVVPGTADSVAPVESETGSVATSKSMRLARNIAAAVGKTWDVAVLEWREWNTGTKFDKVFPDWKPWTGSTYGINIGESLGNWLMEAGLNYKQLHLISHSGGSWLVDAVADELTKKDPTNEWIQLTLFDAFTPYEHGGAVLDWLARTIFFDEPRNIRRWGETKEFLGSRANDLLADSADYAVQFVDTRATISPLGPFPINAIPFTDAQLANAFNYDVTRLDPLWVNVSELLPEYKLLKDSDIFGQAYLNETEFKSDKNIYRRRSHSWPFFLYIDSANHPDASEDSRYSFAFPSSLEWKKDGRPSYDEHHPRGGIIKLPSSIPEPPTWFGVPIDAINTITSTTGFVNFNPLPGVDVQLTTGSPVSITTQFTSSEPVSLLEFDLEFLSESNGQLVITFDGLELMRIHESDLLALGQSIFRDWTITLGQELPAGNHTLTILLDPQAGEQSQIQIDDIRWGVARETPTVPPYQHPWQNYPQPCDVNDDTFVVPLDALRVINELNEGGPRSLTTGLTPNLYVDVNGDDFLSPNDALVVINFINSRASGEGEGVAHEFMVVLVMPPESGARDQITISNLLDTWSSRNESLRPVPIDMDQFGCQTLDCQTGNQESVKNMWPKKGSAELVDEQRRKIRTQQVLTDGFFF